MAFTFLTPKKTVAQKNKEQQVLEADTNKCVCNFCKALLKVLMQHKDVLAAKRRQNQYKNDYGLTIDNGWEKEKEYFIKNVLLANSKVLDSIGDMFNTRYYDYWNKNARRLKIEFTYTNNLWKITVTPNAFDDDKRKKSSFTWLNAVDNIMKSYEFMGIEYEIIGDSKTFYRELHEEARDKCYKTCGLSGLIDAFLDIVCKDKSIPKGKKSANTDPLDYEHEIANRLKELGFNAHVTKATGDQGADVIADKDGVTFAIQCKKYSKPIGNKAVQEANAGRDFYKKDYGVVVTNADFTKSARQLANACDIILLNDRKLQYLLNYVQ